MTRGEIINRRASLGAELVSLRERIPALEKLARKTPPKTLKSEWDRVKDAKAMLAIARDVLPTLEAEYVRLLDLERQACAWCAPGVDCPRHPSDDEGTLHKGEEP